MPRFDFLDLISPSGSPGAGPQVAGMEGEWQPELVEQVSAAHEGWSALSGTDLQVPVVSSFPLKDSPGSGSNLHHAVVVTWQDQQVRHRCFKVPESEYVKLGFDPYALLDAVDPAQLPPRALAKLGEGIPPSPEIRSLVTDALQQLLARGRLHLPLAYPNRECDQILRLLVAAIPAGTKAGLRFTSFCPIEPWLWNLAATRQPGGSLVDWKRRVLDLTGVDQGPDAAAYLRSVADLLAGGNIRGLHELARRSTYHPALNAGARPAARALPERLAPLSADRGTMNASRFSRAKTASAAGEKAQDQEDAPPASRRRVVLERRKLRNITIVDYRRRHGLSGRAATVLGVVLILAAGWWLGSLPRLSLPWVKNWLAQEGSSASESPQGASLLSVVDVGRSYQEIIADYRAKVREDGSKAAKARREALLDLKSGVAVSLAGQVETYLKVVKAGIQQGRQPQREVRRMAALADEGQDLTRDLVRLELAWYSLANEVYWEDLGSLPDSSAVARYDSLQAVRRGFDTAAASELGVRGRMDDVHLARIQAHSMGRLVELFWGESWSEGWQQELLDAASRVPPAASPITRAYGNCAYAFARLKTAEHDPASLGLPFGEGWGQGVWPAVGVRAVLPKLRRAVGMFPAGQAPPVVAGTVELYSLLEEPDRASLRAAADADFWRDLNANPAVIFDPALCEDVIGRLRFEALRPYLDRGDPPTSWPGHLTTLAAAPGFLEFYGVLASVTDPDVWTAYAEDIPDPFLARWAEELAVSYGQAARNRLVDFTRAWDALVLDNEVVRRKAAAGLDWTAAWLDLHTAALDLLDGYVLAFKGNPVCRAQVSVAANLLAAMSEPLTVHLTGVTVELAPPETAGPVTLRLEVRPGSSAPLEQTLPLSASGRIDADLDWSFSLAPGQWVVVGVASPDSGATLWEAVCPALLERVGPGGFVRGLESAGGRAVFRLDPRYWRQLELADLTMVF